MKAFYVLCAIVAIALIIFGIAYPLPGKCVNVSEKYIPRDEISWKDDIGREYINGDCYNYQIEASLKSGYMSGGMTMKSISFVGGWILLCLAISAYDRNRRFDHQSNASASEPGSAPWNENAREHSDTEN